MRHWTSSTMKSALKKEFPTNSMMRVSSWSQPLNKSYYFLDCLYFKPNYMHTFIRCLVIISVQCIIINKLNKLQIQQPNFRFIDNVIFNFSSYNLYKKEKVLLSLDGFLSSNLKPCFSQFFLPFEQFAQCTKPLRGSSSFKLFVNCVLLCIQKLLFSFKSKLLPLSKA